MTRLMKTSILLASCISMAVVASTLYGRPARIAPLQEAAPSGVVVARSVEIAPGDSRAKDASDAIMAEYLAGKPVPENVTSYWQINEVKADASAGVATYSAKFYFYETRPGLRFRWTLNVYDPALKTRFVTRAYNKQIFTPRLGKVQILTFDESVELLDGNYRFELVLHAIPDGVDVSVLDDPKVAESMKVFRSGREVTVRR